MLKYDDDNYSGSSWTAFTAIKVMEEDAHYATRAVVIFAKKCFPVFLKGFDDRNFGFKEFYDSCCTWWTFFLSDVINLKFWCLYLHETIDSSPACTIYIHVLNLQISEWFWHVIYLCFVYCYAYLVYGTVRVEFGFISFI